MNFYELKNDLGDFSLYPQKLFKSLVEVRTSKIDEILLPTEFIFDTNAYRNLVHGLAMGEVIGLAEKLRSKEEALGYNSASSVVVIMELIQHLEEDDPASYDCYRALCMLFHHTSRINSEGNRREGNYYPPINILLAQIFFDSNSKHKAAYDKVVDIFLDLVRSYDLNDCKQFAKEIAAIKSQIIHEKNEFKLNVEEFLSSLNGGTLDWKYLSKNKAEQDEFFSKIDSGEMSSLLALSLMQRAYQVMEEQQLTPDALYRFQKFRIDYEAAILMNLTLLKSIGNGAEKLKDPSDKRWNTLNDVQIMFALLFFKNGFQDKILVTEEKEIKKSAQQAGIGYNVITIDEYKKMVNFDND